MGKTLIALSILALSGCAEMGQMLAESQQMQQPNQRDYVKQPFTPLQGPTTTQTSAVKSSKDQYQMVAVNTSNGVVYRRCKMLNGKAVYCI